MKLQRISIIGIAMMVLATGCSAHGISGAYISRAKGQVDMLQITQGQDGQLLGTLIATAIKPDGSIRQTILNVSGVADQHNLTLIAKSQIPLSPAINLSGVIDRGVITITTPTGQERLTASSPDNYQVAVQQLQAQGAQIQQQKHLADEEAAVADLNKRLTEYAAKIQAPKADQNLLQFHAVHAKALDQAQRQWAAEQKHPRGSFQAGQLQFAVSQTAFNLGLYDNDWKGNASQGHERLQQFDGAIAKNPCHQNPTLQHCTEQPAAIQAYEAARSVVQKRLYDIDSTVKTDSVTLKGLTDQAQDYSLNK
jgi:hypothetical protein